MLQDASDLASYNQDWLNHYTGQSKLVLRPKSTLDVSMILKYCNDHKIAVCPQGGNTGLAGGSVPVNDEVIISTSLMNQVLYVVIYSCYRSFNETNGTLICQTGCVLEKLDQYLGERGYMMPLDLGAKGTCQIGGNLSTNAGGLRYLRYKSLHANVLGLEVVLADGTILDNAKAIRKDNTGLHLDHLFIGSEGTLGVITKCSLQVPLKPKSVKVCLFGVESFEKCVQIFKHAKQSLNQIMSAYEFFDRASLDCVLAQIKGTTYPLEEKYPFYILIETHGSDPTGDGEIVANFCENLLDKKMALDGVIAQTDAQAQQIWKLRETIAESLIKSGPAYKYDVSIPIDHMYSIVDVFRERLKGSNLDTIGFGHMGDDNLHLNFVQKGGKWEAKVQDELSDFLYPWIAEHSGSISAEHGLGVSKNQYLHFSKSLESIKKMNEIKKVFDPNGILNPYKLYPTN